MFDCVIIGTGAAGVSAALTLKALKRDFVLIGNAGLSQKIRCAERIKNYPGLCSVSGGELSGAFLKQLEAEDIKICADRINGVYPGEGGYTLLGGERSYEAKTVIIATGTETFKPVVGEVEFLGRGVSYCAVCDGFLYKGKTIAVIAESAEDAAEIELLSKYADTVYLFSLNKKIEVKAENVRRVDGRVKSIVGDMRVRAVVYDGGELPVDGVFVLKQSVAADTLAHGLKTKDGIVVTDKSGATNLSGVFAAGDCTGRPFQYAKAVGEGNVCAYSVNAYLNANK